MSDVFKEAKLKLTEYIDGKSYSLAVSVSKNNVYVNVSTYDVTNKKYNNISAGFGIIDFNCFLDELENKIKNNDSTITVIENYRVNGKERTLASKLAFGKNDKNKFFISLMASNSEFPKIPFEFKKNNYHTWKDKDASSEYTSEQYSKIIGSTWIRTIRNFLNTEFYNSYEVIDRSASYKNNDKKTQYGKKEPEHDSGDDLNF